VTKALDLSLADRKAELLRWLSEEGRFAPDTGGLLEMLCEKLTVLGAPIARATVHVRTLHPEFRGVSRIWRRGQSTEFRTSRHGIESTSDYQNSPLQYVIEVGQWLDTVLSEATDQRFPILATLRAQGITHYVMAPLIFSNRIVNAISWGSDAPNGFSEADVELFRYLVPTFAPVLEVTAGRRIYGELLATYVGRDPCARIMAGAVQRGNVHHIRSLASVLSERPTRLSQLALAWQITFAPSDASHVEIPRYIAGTDWRLLHIGILRCDVGAVAPAAIICGSAVTRRKGDHRSDHECEKGACSKDDAYVSGTERFHDSWARRNST
jgi:hypothetical protein